MDGYGQMFVEVPYPPLRLSGGNTSIVTGAGNARIPESDEQVKLARELGGLEARWKTESGGLSPETPVHVSQRIDQLRKALNF